MANLWKLPESEVDSLSGPLSGFVVSVPQGGGVGSCLWEGGEGGGMTGMRLSTWVGNLAMQG